MPTYDYSCQSCGPFSDVRPMAEFAQPQPCPSCGDPSPRAFLSAPALGGGARLEAAPAAPMRAHPGGCSCCAAPSARRFTAEAV